MVNKSNAKNNLTQQGIEHYKFKDDPDSSHQVILDLVGKSAGGKLLDVGAADGFLSKRFALNGWKVTGIEKDVKAAQIARTFCDKVYTCDLAHAIPHLEDEYDCIVYGDILEHLVNPEVVFSSINKYLSSNGLIVVSVPNIAHLWMRLSLLFGKFNYEEHGILDRTHLHFFTLKTFKIFLARTDIQVLRTVPTPAPLYLVFPSFFNRFKLKWIHRWNARCAKMLPRLLACQFIAVGRRPK